MSQERQTPFDKAVAAAAAEFRQELEDARSDLEAQLRAERTPWWKRLGGGQ